jgi:integrase
MSIQKKSYLQKKTGKVITKYFASVWDPAHRKSITGPLQLRKKDAVKDEADILKKLEEGKPILSRKNQAPTVEQIYKDWKEYIETIYAVNTYKVYQQWFVRYLQPVFGPERVTGIHTQHISRYLVAMRKKYAPATVNKMLNILVSFFAYCIDIQKLIDINPCAGIKRYPVKPTPKETWNEDTIAEFLDSCEAKESHYYPMFLISLTLGPRPGEVCGLPENGYLRNERKLRFSRGQTNYDIPSDMKNTGAHRTISIPEFICRAIDKHQAWKKRMRLQYPGFADNNYLFVCGDGSPIRPDAYSKAFRRAQNNFNKAYDSSLPYITLYCCRHSFATNNIKNKVSDKVVAEIMGDSVKTVLTCYTHPKDDEVQAAVDDYAEKIYKGL